MTARLLVVVALGSMAVGGCARSGPGPSVPLRIAAASDLQAAFGALAEGFAAQTGVPIEFVPGSSGNLARQIRQGAPFDVFLSADRARVVELAEAGIVRRESMRAYAIGSLVLAVYRPSGVALGGLEDLERPEVKRIALANPDFAPYGLAARQALDSAGLWERLAPKLVMAETVRQAVQFVQTGNAEAGLVGRAVAALPELEVIPIDPALHDPIVQTLGVVDASPRREDADRFAAFLIGPNGQAILERYGFRLPMGVATPERGPLTHGSLLRMRRRGESGHAPDSGTRADQLLLAFGGFFLVGGDRRLVALHQCAELEGQQAVGRCMAPEEGEEGVGPDQDRAGLAVDRQDAPGVGIIQSFENLGEIAVELSATDEANARLGHDHPRGLERPTGEHEIGGDGNDSPRDAK